MRRNHRGLWPGLAVGCAALAAGWAGSVLACGTEELEKQLGAPADRVAGESRARRPVPGPEPTAPWPDYNRHVTFYDNVPQAREAAIRQGRLLFVLQMVGNLRDAGT